MSNVIDIKTRAEKTDIPGYVVEDCQGEMVQATRRLEAAGALHTCVTDMIKEFGKEWVGECLASQFHRCKP